MFSTLRVTSNCNLKCLHCYSMAKGAARTKDLPQGRIKSIIDTLSANGIDHITISGGEPFTRRDITQILSYSSGKAKTGIVSNGTLITRGTAKKLLQISLSRLMISLEGNEAAHDALRGKGAFKKTQKGISNALESGIPLGISTTLTCLNAHDIPYIHSYIRENNIRYWTIQTLKPQGRAKEKSLDIRRDKQSSILETLYSLKSKEKAINISIYDCEKACSAGKKTISVSPDGNVTPCAFMPHAVCGNILKDPWGSIKANIEKYSGATCFQSC